MRDASENKALDPMQVAFVSFAPIRDAVRTNWENYWRSQDKILGSMEELTSGWFERRHEATKTACDAACSMCDAKSPVDMVQHCHTWMMGSMERLAVDALACQKHLMTVTELLVAPLSVGGEAPTAGRVPARSRAVDDARAKAA